MAKYTTRFSPIVAVYVLCGLPRRGIFYVGSSVNPSSRLWQHVTNAASHEDGKKTALIHQIESDGGTIRLIILEWVDESIRELAENWWIGELIMRGYHLVNSARDEKRGMRIRNENRHTPSITLASLTDLQFIDAPKGNRNADAKQKIRDFLTSEAQRYLESL